MKQTQNALAYLMLFPSLALTLLVMGYPVFDLLMTASHQVSRFGVVQGFTGLANFEELFRNPLFSAALWRTIVWTLAVVGGTILVSTPVALILNENFYGRGLARMIVMLPWSVSLTMTAIIWRWALNGQNGQVNGTLFELGLLKEPVEWLATADTSFPIAIAIAILVSIPYTVTVLLGGLSSIPGEVYEAAKIDGSRGLHLLGTITFPLMRSFFTITVVINVINVFNSFPIIWVLTEGGPANGTDVLVTYLYKLAFKFGDLGEAGAMSLVMFAILLVFSLTYLWVSRRSEADA